MRYLTIKDAVSSLRAGRSIEQLLPFREENGLRIIRFVRLDKKKDGDYSVSLFEVIDEGSSNFLDIYEFSPLDPDFPYGFSTSFVNVDEAFLFCRTTLNTNDEKFVSAGMIQDEYGNTYHAGT